MHGRLRGDGGKAGWEGRTCASLRSLIGIPIVLVILAVLYLKGWS